MKCKIKCKRIHLLFLGGILMCLSSACASSGKDGESVLNDYMINEQESKEQHSEVKEELLQFPSSPSTEPSQSGSETDYSQQEIPSSESEKNQSLLAKETYRDILLSNEDFINSGENGEYLERVNIGDITIVFTSAEGVTGKVTKFAIVDMDGDGENEIVLCISTGSIDEGFEVLHYQDGEVYGYHFWYRALEDLAEDGTFIGSGGTSDTSIKKIKFLEKGYAIDTLYESSSHYNVDGVNEIQYYANGEICSEEEFNEAMSYQDKKTRVVWYELTSENVDLAFENRF